MVLSDPSSRSELAGTFRHPGVADAYRHRPPYPAEVFTVLDGLIVDRPRAVLDLGAGEGALARPLAARVDRVDAVDVSEAMIAAGRQRAGGRHEALRWIVGAAETAPLDGPYALATAGASLHWMSWAPLMARLAAILTDRASLAVVEHEPRDVPWHRDLIAVIRRHSRRPGYDPNTSLIDELCAGGHLALAGRVDTAPVPFRQSVADYVEGFHSTSSLARELMPAAEAAAFDRSVAEIVRPWAVDGTLELSIVATISWGRPVPPA